MKEYLIGWACLTVIMIAFVSAGILAYSEGAEAMERSNKVSISTHNVYSMRVTLEVKCGRWLEDKKDFEYHKFFTIPGHKNTVITVPNMYTTCEIWPKVSF